MRKLAWVLLVAGCGQSAVAELESEDLARDWRGRFAGDDGCGSGDLVLSLQTDGDTLFGTLRYETTDAWAGRVHALYQVRGQVTGGVVVVEQLDLYEADALPDFERWCSGRLELARQGDALAGAWVPSDCACAGDVVLE